MKTRMVQYSSNQSQHIENRRNSATTNMNNLKLILFHIDTEFLYLFCKGIGIEINTQSHNSTKQLSRESNGKTLYLIKNLIEEEWAIDLLQYNIVSIEINLISYAYIKLKSLQDP